MVRPLRGNSPRARIFQSVCEVSMAPRKARGHWDPHWPTHPGDKEVLVYTQVTVILNSIMCLDIALCWGAPSECHAGRKPFVLIVAPRVTVELLSWCEDQACGSQGDLQGCASTAETQRAAWQIRGTEGNVKWCVSFSPGCSSKILAGGSPPGARYYEAVGIFICNIQIELLRWYHLFIDILRSGDI